MRIVFNVVEGIGVPATQLIADVEDFSSEDFAKKLINPQPQFISIGNNGFAKTNLVSWKEVPSEIVEEKQIITQL
ncbi:hypothetical protein KDN24_00485 [Bacillus sp. Bva_UNVM-123]|uniref:hypothetical protein n=1 Tax=Bacillus sp. Bva_UNVM-123 TaxID=2829798 RepID=UPI00391F086E